MQGTPNAPMTGIEVATRGRRIQYIIHHIEYSSQSVYAECVHLQYHVLNFISYHCISITIAIAIFITIAILYVVPSIKVASYTWLACQVTAKGRWYTSLVPRSIFSIFICGGGNTTHKNGLGTRLLIRCVNLIYACTMKDRALKVNACPFCELNMPMNGSKLHFPKMMWKIMALSLSNVPHLNCYMMHISNLTQNLGYLSLVKRYWGFKLYFQFVPLKNVWGKLMHVDALTGFDVP